MTEGTERLRIDSAGVVKIGSNTLVTPDANADNLVIDTGDVDSGISILSATTGRIYFGDASADAAGSIRYVHTDNSMRFETNSAERLRIDSDGIRISNTNYSASAQANELIIGNTDNSNNRGLTIASGNLKSSSIYFGDNNNNAIGTIIYSHALDALQIATNGSERLRIGSAGQIGLGGANYGSATQVLTSNGSSAAPTWEPIPAASTPDKIEEGNTSAEVIDTGSDGHFKVLTEGTERLRIGPAGQIGLSGANYGSATQVLTSNGSSAAPTWQPIPVSDKIEEGNTSAEVVDTGSDGHFKVTTEGTERLRIGPNGQIGLGGANYGTANKVLTSNGPSAAPTWQSISVPDKIEEGNTSAEVVDTNGDGHFKVITEGTERLRIGSAGQIGLGGANYGSATQVLTSNGSSAAPTWQPIPGASIPDKIEEGNTKAEVVDTNGNGHFFVETEGTERFRIDSTGTATFTADITAGSGNPGQINIDPTTSTSNGRIKYSGTKTFMIEGGTNSDNKIEIHGHENSLNILCEGEGETELYYNGNKKLATNNDGISVTGISGATEGFDFGVKSGGSLVTTNSVKTLNFSGSNNTITYDASTKTVDIDIDGSSGSGGGTVFSGTFTASAGSPSTLNTYAYDSAELVFEYTVFVKNGSDYQTQKLLVMRDGTTVDSTQYAVMYSNGLLVQLDATISGSNILLRATPGTGVSGSTTYKVKREVI